VRLLSTEVSSRAQGPVTAASGRFDPFEPGYVRDPYPLLAELRASEPVFFASAIGSWIVTRFDTAKAVLRDTQRFCARARTAPTRPTPRSARCAG
jgi:cytochrome P450